MKLEVKQQVSWERVERVEKEELLSAVRRYFSRPAYVYAEMTYASGLGRYRDGTIRIGLGREKRIVDLQTAHVRVLRVFDALQEFRAISKDNGFCCRILADQETAPDGFEGTFQKKHRSSLDETHKLWGLVCGEELEESFCLLRDKRGNTLLFPEKKKEHEEIGLQVRNYIEFPDAALGEGLIRFPDERLCGFVDWNDAYAAAGGGM